MNGRGLAAQVTIAGRPGSRPVQHRGAPARTPVAVHIAAAGPLPPCGTRPSGPANGRGGQQQRGNRRATRRRPIRNPTGLAGPLRQQHIPRTTENRRPGQQRCSRPDRRKPHAQLSAARPSPALRAPTDWRISAAPRPARRDTTDGHHLGPSRRSGSARIVW